MKVYIGIDWSEAKHDICFMNEAGEVINQIQIKHTPEGYQQFDQARQKFGIEPKDCMIGIETSHNALIDYLTDMGYCHIHIIHPSAVHHAQKIYYPSGAKSDKTDAWLIAELLRRDHGRFPEWVADSTPTRQIRAHVSMIMLLNKQIRQSENRLRAALLRYYPVATELFSSLTCPISLEWIKAYPTPEMAAKVKWEEFEVFLKEHHHTRRSIWLNYFKNLQLNRVRAANDIVMIYSQEAIFLAELLLRMISIRKALLATISSLYEKHPDYEIYHSLPGAGEYLEPALLAKLGDNRLRFPSHQMVQSIAGTCPVTKQSGKSKDVIFRKICDHEFRHIVQQWAMASVKRSAWAASYYSAARPHCDSDNEAFRKLANRWLEVLWRLWHDHVPYDEEKHLHRQALRCSPKK